MPTIKLVVIGASGVGKTSLRTQYISGRFSTGYRATIGADFISKTLPHPTRPDQVVTLQIWDTAGQERFSSLSSAFFRGADAALLMFDVNQPESLLALKAWWQAFCECAPLDDDAREDYCCVVVGNKTDLAPGGSGAVSEAQAFRFLDDLVPRHRDRDVPIAEEEDGGVDLSSSFPPRSRSIDIDIHPYVSKSSLGGTLSSGVTSYHTPSSSLFDVYASARTSRVSSPARTRRTASFSSTVSSARTITPSLFRRADRGPKLFYTSAKTGEGVHEVFEYIARRVVERWAYEEVVDARTVLVPSPEETRIRLAETTTRGRSGCC